MLACRQRKLTCLRVQSRKARIHLNHQRINCTSFCFFRRGAGSPGSLRIRGHQHLSLEHNAYVSRAIRHVGRSGPCWTASTQSLFHFARRLANHSIRLRSPAQSSAVTLEAPKPSTPCFSRASVVGYRRRGARVAGYRGRRARAWCVDHTCAPPTRAGAC